MTMTRSRTLRVGLLRCSRRTWVLRGYDGLLLENVSHVAIQRPLWRAAGLGAQVLDGVEGRDGQNWAEPARW